MQIPCRGVTILDMTAEPSSPWVVGHPDELIATFVIQLPDRMDLPDGITLPSFEALQFTSVAALRPFVDALAAYRTGEGVMEPLSTIVGDGAFMDWASVALQRISMQVHQVTSDVALRLQLEPSARLAHILSGDPLTLDQKQQSLTGPGSVPDGAWEEAIAAGAGQITIVECAVGLRLVGTPPMPEDDYPHLEANKSFVGPPEFESVHPGLPSVWRWHFADHIDPALLQRRLGEALDFCLGELRDLQRMVHTHRRTPLQLVATELLPVLVPVVLRPLGRIGQPDSPVQMQLVPVRSGPDTLPPPRPYSQRDLAELAMVRRQMLDTPFTVHLDLHREARVAGAAGKRPGGRTAGGDRG